MHNPFPNDIQPNTKYGQFPSLPLPFHPKTGKVLCRGNRSIPSNIKMLLCPRPHLDRQFQTITHSDCLGPSPISLLASAAASQTACSTWAITRESVPSRTSPTAQAAVSHLPASADLSLLLWGSSHQPTMRPLMVQLSRQSSLVSRLGAQQLLARRQHVSKKHTLGLSTSKLKAALVLLLCRTDNPFGGPPAQNSAEKALKLPITMSLPHWSCCGWDFEHSKGPAVKGRSKGFGGVTPNPRAQVFLFSGMRVHHKEAERPAIHSHYGCVTEEDLNSPEM